MAATLLTLTTQPGRAEYRAVLGSGVDYTDNLFLTEDDTQSETVFRQRLQLGYIHSSPTLDTTLDSDLSFLQFTGDTARNELRGEGRLDANWHIVSDRLDWIIEDQLQETRSDAFETSGLSQTGTANTFLTGPDLLIGKGRTDRLTVRARYGQTHIEGGDNSSRAAYGARWRHELSNRAGLFVDAERQHVQFEGDQGVGDFDRDDLVVGWDYRRPLTEIAVQGGVFEIRDALGDGTDITGEIYRFLVSRRMTEPTTITFTAERATEDPGDRLFREGDSATGLTGAEVIVDADLAERDTFDLTAEHRGRNLLLRTTAAYSTEDFRISDDNDTTTWGGRWALDYRFPRGHTLFASSGYTERTFDTVDRVDDELTAALGYRRVLAQRWAVEARYDFNYRDSTAPAEDFTENRIGLELSYRWGSGAELNREN